MIFSELPIDIIILIIKFDTEYESIICKLFVFICKKFHTMIHNNVTLNGGNIRRFTDDNLIYAITNKYVSLVEFITKNINGTRTNINVGCAAAKSNILEIFKIIKYDGWIMSSYTFFTIGKSCNRRLIKYINDTVKSPSAYVQMFEGVRFAGDEKTLIWLSNGCRMSQ
jgi:hypothetical protein